MGFAIGSFEVNMENGDVRYRYGLHAGDEGFSTSAADAMLGIAANALDKHVDAFMSVAFGDIEPAAAVIALES